MLEHQYIPRGNAFIDSNPETNKTKSNIARPGQTKYGN